MPPAGNVCHGDRYRNDHAVPEYPDDDHGAADGKIRQLVLAAGDPVLYPDGRDHALLSFAYSLLASDCTAALQSVGLDPYVGFLHRARPGRRSLALDLMEELRTVYADRFVLSCINQKIMTPKHFQKQENGAVLLTDEGRRAFLGGWQTRKQETITHPFLNEKLLWGLVPYVQALLLARTLRGDMELYPPFFWK